MGYTTNFSGGLTLSRQLTAIEKEYINLFSETRRMKRNPNVLMEIYKGEFGLPIVQTNLLPATEGVITEMVDNGKGEFIVPDRTALEIYGIDGAFFAKDDGQCGQSHDRTIIDYNLPPGTPERNYDKLSIGQIIDAEDNAIKKNNAQPSLWCNWWINEKDVLEWNGAEKFYNYIEWLEYLIRNFFQPWGVLLNGKIKWSGEDDEDMGNIFVTNNIVNPEKR